jgi:hypothetical protein
VLPLSQIRLILSITVSFGDIRVPILLRSGSVLHVHNLPQGLAVLESDSFYHASCEENGALLRGEVFNLRQQPISQEKNQLEEQKRSEAAKRQQKVLEADKALFVGFAELPMPADGGDADPEYPQPTSVENRKISEQARAEPIERVEYAPADPDWEQKERCLLDELKQKDEQNKDKIEQEPPGIDDVLAASGFASPATSAEDRKLAEQTNVSIGTQRRGGYDLLR